MMRSRGHAVTELRVPRNLWGVVPTTSALGRPVVLAKTGEMNERPWRNAP
jgi:hypothetical protein